MIHPELDAEQLYAQLEAAIKPALAGTDRLAVVGIYSGGAWLAERLAHHRPEHVHRFLELGRCNRRCSEHDRTQR